MVHLLAKHTKNHQVPKLTPELTDILKKHSWPGNVRELENFCERYLLIGNDMLSVEEDIKEWFLPCRQNTINTGEEFVLVNQNSLSEMENEIILKTMQKFNGNKNKVAAYLGISRTTLWKKLKNNHTSNLN
jgi:transcriptional regulator with PAS, ATPase and Fis domain